MNLKKLGLSVLALGMLVGCTQQTSNNGGGNAEETPSGGKTKVVLWHSYTKAQNDFIDNAVAEFNASQDEVEVVAEFQSSSEITDKTYQAVMAGNGPDMLINFPSEASRYVLDNKLVDLETVLSADTVGLLGGSALEEAKSFTDGKMHFIQIVNSEPIFIYNKDIYDELGLTAPKTWDELVANCEKIKEAYPDVAPFAFDSETDGAQMLIMQTGNKMFDADGIYLDAPEVVERMQFYQDNILNGNFTNAKVGDYYSDDFVAGTLASYIGSIAGYYYVITDDGPTVGFGPCPQLDMDNQWVPAWNRGFMVFDYADEARAAGAGKFIDFFCEPARNAEFCAIAAYPAAFEATKQEPAYQEFVNGDAKAAYDCLNPEHSGTFPAITTQVYNRTAMRNLMSAVAGGADVEESVKAAVAYIEEQLAAE